MSDTTTTPEQGTLDITTPETAAPLGSAAKSGNDVADTLHAAFRRAGADLVKARRMFVEAAASARDGLVWQIRGFDSWTAYATATVKATGLKVTGEERDYLAATLVALGVSERDAADALGTSQATVNRAKGKEAGKEAAAAVKEVTGEEPATETVTRTGAKVKRDAPKGNGKAPAAKAPASDPAPKEQPSRSPYAVSRDAAAVISGQWHHLTAAQREEILDMLTALEVDAETH